MATNEFVNCQNANMADAAAARREARKRKILENSQNRLQRIAGKCEEEFSKGTVLYCQANNVLYICVSKSNASHCFVTGSPIRTLLPEESYEAPLISESDISFRGSNTLRTSSSLNNGVFVAETPLVEPLSFSQQFGLDATGDGLAGVATDLAALMSPAPETASIQEVTLWSKLVLYKYDIVLVSLLVQLLYSFSLLTFDETYFFLPLVVYVVTKMIWFPAPSSSNFANALLLLNGISVDRVEKIMSVVRCVTMFSQDACVYLFTTICMQALCTTMQDSLKA